MARLSQLEGILFPVEERPVFTTWASEQGEEVLRVHDKKAIVDRESRRVVGVVSSGYRLVTNQQALDWGRECCGKVFPETKPAEWEVKTVDAPASAGFCFIDLVHNSTALDFQEVTAAQRPDSYGPFIRVTNSYNTQRALAFDIGFFRKVCKNGMIVPETMIQFKFSHVRRDIGETIEFEISHSRLQQFKASFAQSFGTLRKCTVPRASFEPFVFGVLRVREPEELTPHSPEAEDWAALTAHTRKLSDGYAGELGENAYAVFNTITEFASHPPQNRWVRRERHSLQRLAGSWYSTFTAECVAPEFQLTEYLNKLAKERNGTNGNGTPGAEATHP